MLGYIPDRAYYLTVGRTVDLGVLAWSPINLCPPTNETLPCPAPVGARRPVGCVAGRAGPAAAPDRRRGRPGRDAAPVHRRDRRHDRAVDGLRRARRSGPATSTSGPRVRRCPSRAPTRASRSSPAASTSSAASTPTAPRRRPTYVLAPDGTTGELGEWKEAPEDLVLPEARSRRRGGPTADGLLLIGGRNADGPVDDDVEVDCSTQQRRSRRSGPTSSPSRRPQTGATAGVVGDFVWLYGGRDANGPVGDGPARRVRPARRRGPPENPDEGKVVALGHQRRARTCPGRAPTPPLGASTARSTSPAATTGPAPARELYWAVPIERRRHRRVEAPRRQRPARPR